MMNILEVNNIEVYIGSFYILQGVTLNVKKGEVTVLLGRNGAGKSTTMKSILGLHPPKTGNIIYKGKNINKLPAHKIANRGIGYVPDTRRIFGTLTVEQNLIVAMRKSERSKEDRMQYIYELFPDLNRFRTQKAKSLSGGQQQMLAIGRALSNDNDLLLIDEPTEGLSPKFAKLVMRTLHQIKDQVTILLVEQNFRAATSIGDNYYIMDDGKVAYEGLMNDLVDNTELITKFLGVRV
ncbi:MAG: ABC transporter ATP-binding protein [Candidatus Kariarchaeaceae archaeon]